MMATILNSAILDSVMLHKTLTQSNSIWLKLIHSDWTWWWQPYWILPSWIKPFAQKKLHSCILTQIDDGSPLDFCHQGFSHFAEKRSSLIHSNSTWWWQPYWILPSWIQPFCTKNFTKSFSLNLMMAAILNSAIFNSAILHKKLHLIILTQLDDGNHLEFCHLGFTHFAQNSDSN